MHAMQCACWPCCCYCSLCCCHHCCSQVYDLAATSAASSGCAAYTIVATAATTPDTIASTIGECCFFCPLCYHCCPPRACLSASFSSALPSLGLAPAVPALLWLPLTLSASRCVCESAMSHINTQAHDLTHTTQVRGVTCKSMTSPRVHASVHGVNDHVCMRV